MAELVGGALLGVAVGELLKNVIDVLKMACHCKKNCRVLLTTLESIFPLLDQVAKSANSGNMTCQEWLESMRVILTEAKSIVNKCSQKKTWSDFTIVKKAQLSSKILEIDNEIRKKLPEASLITLDIVQDIHSHVMMSSASNVMVNNGGSAAMQDTPYKIVPFVANPLEKVKNMIMTVAEGMRAPMTIGLKGMGGVGKSLLAKMVNNDEDIRRTYATNSILWITIGRDATIPSLYLTMAKLIEDGGVYERDYKHRNLEDQRGYLLATLKKKKVLLILDDVWDSYPVNNCAMIEWLDVAKGLGSVTLVTTRELAVLKCGKAEEVVEVGLLEEDGSWELFCVHAFGRTKPAASVIESIAKEVCKECGRLPLAIMVIGSAMHKKNDEGEWRRALNYLKGSVSTLHSKSDEREVEHKLYNCLKYSYEVLDDKSKKCFLYFAAFLEDRLIHSQQLCRIWHAEQLFGSINADESNSIGWSTLVDLGERSLIDIDDISDDGWLLRIHDVLRDLAIRILRDATPNDWIHDCSFQPGKVFDAFPVIKKTMKRMSLIGCTFQEFPSKLELPYLEVCLLSNISGASNERRLVIPKGFFSSMNALLMLDMSNTHNVDMSLLDFEGLKSLKHLDLSGCDTLTNVSKSIEELQSLTHLMLGGCRFLEEIPKNIGELKSLTHLDLSGCGGLTSIPKSIGELPSLAHLNVFKCYGLTKLPESVRRFNCRILRRSYPSYFLEEDLQ